MDNHTVSDPYVLDRLFNENDDEVELTFRAYYKYYNLEKIHHDEEVSSGFFEHVRSRDKFVIVVAYDQLRRIFLHAVTEGGFGWALPGSGIRPKEAIFEAVRRVIRSKSPLIEIAEIEPIATLKNNFHCDGKVHSHEGILFAARIRNPQDLDPRSSCSLVGIDDTELKKINRHANRRSVEIALARVREFEIPKQDNEILVNETVKSRYAFHNLIVKKYFLTKKRRRKNEQIQLIAGIAHGNRSIIDVSAGDNSLAQEILKWNKAIHAFFVNDISWSQVELAKTSHPKIIYSNHDATYLPFKDAVFDLAICMNTLHHMPSRTHLLKLLESMKRVSKNVLVWEISNPKHGRIIPRLINLYYEKWLKDQANAYLDESDFQALINSVYHGSAISFGRFKNIQGVYNYAMVSKI